MCFPPRAGSTLSTKKGKTLHVVEDRSKNHQLADVMRMLWVLTRPRAAERSFTRAYTTLEIMLPTEGGEHIFKQITKIPKKVLLKVDKARKHSKLQVELTSCHV